MRDLTCLNHVVRLAGCCRHCGPKPLILCRAVLAVQSLTLAILCQFALAAPAAESKPAAVIPPTAGYESVVAEYARMTPAERQQYVERLIEARLEPAAQLTLDDAALARQQAIDREILARLRDGRTISPQGLVKLLRKLDTLESAAVESLTRDYRVEVYSLFHSQRREYDERIEVWKRVEAAWAAHGKLPDEQRQLIAWLRRATDRLRADSSAKLPPIPQFAERTPPKANPAAPRIAVAPRGPGAADHPVEPAPIAAGRRQNVSQLPDLDRTVPTIASLPAQHPASPAAGRPASAAPADTSPPQALATKPLAKQRRQVYLALRPVERPGEPDGARPTRVADSGLESQPGQIDLDELSVRIAGHNLALSRLAGRLHGKEPWTVRQLSAAVAELEDLTARRGDLFLYWDLIEEQDRAVVGKLQTPAATIALLGARISYVHNSVAGQHANQADADDDTNLAEIDGLSRRLAQLAVEPDR
jgi:hypothetical protein